MQNPVICGVYTADRDLRGADQLAQNAIDYTCQLIDFAAAVGAELVCGPMYSATGRTGAHSTSDREQQLQQIAQHLNVLGQRAGDKGITLAIEPLNRFETDCINTVEQAQHLIGLSGSPALKIHIDTFHMAIEEVDSAAAIRRAGSLIAHVHASASNRGIPGQDQVHWHAIFAALHEIGYTADIGLESFSEDNQVIARAASIWRKLYDSPEELSVKGLNFLRAVAASTASNPSALNT